MKGNFLSIKFILIVVKIAISVAAIAYLADYFFIDTETKENWKLLMDVLRKHPFVIPMLLSFSFSNWLVESFKWKYLLKPQENISIFRAFQAVISGVTIGLFTPNRIGEYAGRVWYTENKIFAIAATVTGNICQLTITILLGITGIILVPQVRSGNLTIPYVNIVLPALIFLLIAVILYRKWIVTQLHSLRIKFLSTLLSSFGVYSRSVIIKTLLISALRYLLFWFPFAWLLSITYQAPFMPFVWIVPLVLVTQTFLPSFAIAEAGTRMMAMGLIMFLINLTPTEAILSSLLIWMANIILPALLGIVFIWTSKQHVQ